MALSQSRFLYFSTGGGANASGEASYFPASNFMGFNPYDATHLDMHFKSINNCSTVDIVRLTIETNKHKDIMDIILRLINWNSDGSSFTNDTVSANRSHEETNNWSMVICDKDNGKFASGWITDCTITFGTACAAGTTYACLTDTTLGIAKVEDNTIQTTAANAVTTTASRTYGVQKNSDCQLVVNVPWEGRKIPVKVDGVSLTTELTSIDYVDGVTSTNSGTGDITVKPDRYTNGGIKLDGGKLRLDLGESAITGVLPIARGGTGSTAALTKYDSTMPLYMTQTIAVGERWALSLNTGKGSTALGTYEMTGSSPVTLTGDYVGLMGLYDNGDLKWTGLDIYINQSVVSGTNVKLDFEVNKLAHSAALVKTTHYTFAITKVASSVTFANNTEYKKLSYNSGFPALGSSTPGFYTFSIFNSGTAATSINANIVLRYQIGT
tara:strand:+ start:4531 stop:5847 length:1317 start_codon:yes stop_codon:yes gene_type:complete